MPTRTSTEIERKFVPAPGAALPDLGALPDVEAVRRLDDEHLDATYYDTDDLRLAAAGLTLRCRAGGRDAGWTLKLPGAKGRQEVFVPAADPDARDADGVPEELRSLARARTRERDLVPVLRLRTRREVTQVLGAGEEVLAEVADDTVTADVLLPPVRTTAWRELEVELVGGDERLLAVVGERLRRRGATPSPSTSKLGAALADRLPPVAPVEARKPTAGDALVAHLRDQVQELLSRDPWVRRDAPDALHKARVATRRMRSALRTYRPLLDRAVTDPVRAELSWFAAVLGEARDAEVMRARLRAAAEALPPELLMGPVLARIDSELASQHREAHARVVAELDGERYLALLDTLDRLVAEPPLTERADRPAGKELRRLVLRAWEQLAAEAAAADAAPTPEEREYLLHEARKVAKQVRYAAESAAPVLGSKATAFASQVAGVQEALGEHQDSVVTREALRELGVHAHLAGENGFTFGLLHGLEALHADRAERTYVQLWRELSQERATAWLR